MQSAVMIVPAAGLDAANAFGASMGWGERNYTVPLSATGAEPATHWGCRADVSDGFFALLESPPAEALPVLALVQMDFRTTSDPAGHFREVIAGLGLSIIEAGE